MRRPSRSIPAALVLLGALTALAAPTPPRPTAPRATATSAPASPVPSAAAGAEVLRLRIDGIINAASASYISEGIAAAQGRGALALLIELDTPGGMLDSTKLMVKDLLGAPLPVIVYVAPSGATATSAGVFVTLAAHVAAMAPGTTIGAAHPVGSDGGDIEGDMREKVENATVSLGRSIAEQRGRNVDWAEKAVRKSVSVTEREAVKLKVVDFVADSVDDVLVKASGRTVSVQGKPVTLALAGAALVPFEMRLAQRFLDFLAHPNIAYLLLMAGLLGLYVEFTNPGVIFPGVAGTIALLLALAAMQLMPVNWAGLALIGLGVAMLIAEAFLPTFGVVGVGGIVAFVLGSLLLFETPDAAIRLDRGLIAGAAATLGGFALVVGWLVFKTQRQPSRGGAEGMLGEIGEVRRSDAGGRIKVFVRGEIWDADSVDALAVGDAIEVIGVDGLRVHVRRRTT
ncbi:MAG: nodulation protein NfeD [Deltaproteobacteria bacterium]|nr:nodulation protein NfeD [Deltaproteobacteria bacterium]